VKLQEQRLLHEICYMPDECNQLSKLQYNYVLRMLALLAKVQNFNLLFDKIIGAGDYFALTDIVTLYEVKVKHKTLK